MSKKLEMAKKIITHINPDLDAITSVWLLKRFLPSWKEAEINFINAGLSTENVENKNQNSNELTVDVGRGKLDHHQTGQYLSAAKLCFDYIQEKRKGQQLSPLEKEALEQLVEVVTQIDNARDLNWQEISENRFQFQLSSLIDGLRGIAETDRQVIEFGLKSLDAVFLNLRNKIRAIKELRKGIEFQTKWGKGISLESGNKHVIWHGEALGYVLVINKDPESGGVQIYSRPDSGADLTEAYNKFNQMDPESDWFLHATKKLLLNQASVNPNMRPTKLKLEEIIKILKER